VADGFPSMISMSHLRHSHHMYGFWDGPRLYGRHATIEVYGPLGEIRRVLAIDSSWPPLGTA
jgi:hypothetical protein